MAFLFFSRVFLQKKGAQVEYGVESIRPYKEGFVIKLKEVDSLLEARELVGKEILIPEDELQSLEEDEYYVFQLIGCSVVTKTGSPVGTVEDILTMPESELLVVQGQGKNIFIPLVHEICLQINVEKREIIIDPPEGLLDLNEI